MNSWFQVAVGVGMLALFMFAGRSIILVPFHGNVHSSRVSS